jgi:predicted AAA+ superfamily ATPase
MEFIQRTLESKIKSKLFNGKAIVVYGARQTGKTSLVQRIVDQTNEPATWFNGDEFDVAAMLSNKTSVQLGALFGNHRIVVIDEAQRIKNIGITLKLIVDQLKEYQVIATGSSSFDLANKINEPLTGRKWLFQLVPLTFEELANHYGLPAELRMLEQRLVFGSYPEIVTSQNKEEVLKLLASDYLYKDILSFDSIKKSDKIYSLLKALALQIGSPVSYSELSRLTGIDIKTVQKYIDILEQAFIIFRLTAFRKNIRTELKKSRKIYFWDNGIRNAIIGNFDLPDKRTDIGQLWENYIVSERNKYLSYQNSNTKLYFWRTTQNQEIDLIEESSQQLQAVEIKWNVRAKKSFSKTFTGNYPDTGLSVISKDNYVSYISRFQY